MSAAQLAAAGSMRMQDIEMPYFLPTTSPMASRLIASQNSKCHTLGTKKNVTDSVALRQQTTGYPLGSGDASNDQEPAGRPGLRPRVPGLRAARLAADSAGLRPRPISLASAERCLA